MKKFSIEVDRNTFIFDYWKVTGFSDEEMHELLTLDEEKGYYAMRDRLVEIIDAHNPGHGTAWGAGYGIYDVKFHKDYPNSVFVETGSSCD